MKAHRFVRFKGVASEKNTLLKLSFFIFNIDWGIMTNKLANFEANLYNIILFINKNKYLTKTVIRKLNA